MGNQSAMDELKELLRPFVREHPLKKDTVREEDVERVAQALARAWLCAPSDG